MPHTNEVEQLVNENWDERILVCRNGRLVQTFIVVTKRYVVLVDTLINATTVEKMIGYARPFLEGRRLLVVNTHGDYDHCLGNQLFAGPDARYPAPIFGHHLVPAQFEKSEAKAFVAQLKEQEPAVFADVVPTPPTILFHKRLHIDGGDLTLEIFPTPGHTPDHVSIYLPEINTLLAADGAEIPFPFARSVDGLPQMRSSLAQMAALEPAVALYCHAPVSIGPQLLHDNIAYFDYLESCCRRALGRGVPSAPAEDADVAALVDCAYEDAVPAGGPWDEVHEHYRTAGHAQQIRMMLKHLAG